MPVGAALHIEVLGDLRVQRDCRDIELPPSKKTRALLAYLSVVERPQRRERLCELFWQVPDDPRGALRWSLSKIRQVVNDGEQERLQADREFVSLRKDGIAVDYGLVSPLQSRDLGQVPLETLEAAAAAFRGRFLDDLGLPRCPEFEAWRVGHANELDLTRLRVLRMLIKRLAEDPERALVHAHVLQRLAPEDPEIAREIEALNAAARDQARRPAAAAPAASPDGPPPGPEVEADDPSPPLSQQVRFCMAEDGTRLAYALSGQGLPILRAAHWMSHLDHDWDSPVWRHWIRALSERNTLVRYDQRGNGLSDRGVADLSFDAMVADLECVADAAGLDRFVLLGVSQSCAHSVAYTVRHPERVVGLILYGGYVKGWRRRGDPSEIARREAILTLIREGWGQNAPIFRQIFTSMFLPGGTREQVDWYNDLQLRTATAEDAHRLASTAADIDVEGLLEDVRVPTLVLHARDDLVAPFEFGEKFAEGIPGAAFVALDSPNHILLEDEPAFGHLVSEVGDFLERATAPVVPPMQTNRQVTAATVDLAGDVTEPDLPATVQSVPLAKHALEGETWEQAARSFLSSARRELARSAHTITLNHIRNGLAALERLPAGRERSRLELDYRRVEGVAWMAAKGWGADEVSDAYARAEKLCEMLGDETELFTVLRGKAQYCMASGRPLEAQLLGRRCRHLVTEPEDVGRTIEAAHVFWTNGFFLGDYRQVVENADVCVELYDPALHHGLTFEYSGYDPGVCCRVFQGMALFLQARPDEAHRWCREALELAESLDHPLTTAIAYWGLSYLGIFAEEPEAALSWADRAVALSEQRLLPLLRSQGEAQAGWAVARLGDLDGGIRRMETGILDIRTSGAEMGLPYLLSLLGRTYMEAGLLTKAARVIDDALQLAERNGSRFQLPEILGTKAALAATAGSRGRAQAETLLREALSIARNQGAGLPELRAATALARHLRDSRRGGEAADLMDRYRPLIHQLDGLADARAAAEVI